MAVPLLRSCSSSSFTSAVSVRSQCPTLPDCQHDDLELSLPGQRHLEVTLLQRNTKYFDTNNFWVVLLRGRCALIYCWKGGDALKNPETVGIPPNHRQIFWSSTWSCLKPMTGRFSEGFLLKKVLKRSWSVCTWQLEATDRTRCDELSPVYPECQHAFEYQQSCPVFPTE